MQTNKILRTIIQVLLFTVPFIVLSVAGSLYFPYITGKGFLFRTVIIISTVLYLVLVVRDRSYLPKKSVLLSSLIAFVLILGVATLTSINPFKSFWSNYERMEGYVLVLHLLAFFVISSTVLTQRLWFWLLHTSLFASVITGLVAYSGLTPENVRIAGSLGNSTYLGVYALLHIFIAGSFLLGVIEKKEKTEAIPWAFGYLILIVFNTAVLYQTGTRGSFVGLVAGGLLTCLILLIFEKKNKTIKYFGGVVLALVVVVVILLGSFKQTEFVQKSTLLNRFSSLITTDIGSVVQNQGYARTVIWSMAYNGFKERPILGWGQDNFGFVFAKYYDPRMYSQEQWFDRSHNVFLDWLIAGGILALLGYLSLFVAVLYLLWRRNPNMSEPWAVSEKAVITGLFVAYFVHNLFVFDNLISYILFFTLIAYIHERSTRHIGEKAEHVHLIKNQTHQSVVVVLIVIVGVFILNSVVIKPYAQGSAIIDALRSQSGTVDKAGRQTPPDSKTIFTYYQKALSYDSFGKAEGSERTAEALSKVVADPQTPAEIKFQAHTLVQNSYLELMKKHKGDPRYPMLFGLYLDRLGAYSDALKYYKEALDLSPNKQTFMYQVSTAALSTGDKKTAIEVAKRSYEVLPENPDAFRFYIYMLIKTGDFKGLDEVAKTPGGLAALADQRIVQGLIEEKQFARVIEIGKLRIQSEPNNPQVHLSVAAAYLKVGNKQAAINEIRETIRLAPEFKEQGEFYISEIRAGRNPGDQK